MNNIILYVCIKYSMCDLFCAVISYCVCSCDMGKINVYHKIDSKQEKNKIWKSIYISLHLKIVLKWNSQLSKAG